MKINVAQRKIKLPLEEILDSIKTGIVAINADYSINMMNLELMNMFRYKKDELLSRHINILFNSDEYTTLQNYLKKADYSKTITSDHKFELNGFRRDKSNIPLEITILKYDGDNHHMYILIMRNISTFKQTMDELKYLAYYDQLTKIPNRTLFMDRAETSIRQARREDEKLAIVYIDIDEFKLINDTLGHDGGDILLKELSQRLENCVRDSDTVSRVGGDEFIILMIKPTCLEDVSILAERIMNLNLLSIKINDQDIFSNTSLGISIFPNDGDNIDILLKNADTAMYFAKQKGKNQFAFYNPIMKKKIN